MSSSNSPTHKSFFELLGEGEISLPSFLAFLPHQPLTSTVRSEPPTTMEGDKERSVITHQPTAVTPAKSSGASAAGTSPTSFSTPSPGHSQTQQEQVVSVSVVQDLMSGMANMAAMFQSTMETFRPATLSASSQQVTFLKPTTSAGKFDGSSNPVPFNTWCFQVEQDLIARKIGQSEPESVHYAAALFSGRAAVWWQSVHSSGEAASLSSWTLLKPALEAEFVPRISELLVKAQIRRCQQGASQSVAEHISAFRQLCNQLKNPNDPGLVGDFVHSLRREVLDRATLQHGEALALLADPDESALNKWFRFAEAAGTALDLLNFKSRQDAAQVRPFLAAGGSHPYAHATTGSGPRHPAQQASLQAVAGTAAPAGRPRTVPRPAAAPAASSAAFVYPPPLTPEEKQRCREEGRCVRCRELGHFPAFCPVFNSAVTATTPPTHPNGDARQ